MAELSHVDFNGETLEIADAAARKSVTTLETTQGNISTELSSISTKADTAKSTAETAQSIAMGKNQAHVFATTAAMQTWLSSEENKGVCQVGDNLYIIATDVPDWWISEVLDTADADTGYYYKIAELETQKVDLTTINENLATQSEQISALNSNLQATDGLQFNFATDGEGNYGFLGADGSLIPFRRFKGLETQVGSYSSYSSSSDRMDFQKTISYTATEDCFVVIFTVGGGLSSPTNTTSVSGGAQKLLSTPIYLSNGGSYSCGGYCALVYCPKGSTVSHYFQCTNYSHGGYFNMYKLN